MVLLTGTTASALEFRIGNRFFDYGNGAVNLENVTHVSPSAFGYITLSSDAEENIMKKYSSSEKSKVKESWIGWLDAYFDTTEAWYFYELNGEVTFDLFTLRIFDTVRFLKLPSTQGEWAAVNDLKKFQLFLDELESHLTTEGLLAISYDDPLRSFGTRYDQLAAGLEFKRLTAENTKKARSDLLKVHEVYEAVIKY